MAPRRLPSSTSRLLPLATCLGLLGAASSLATPPENRPHLGTPVHADHYLVSVEEGSPWGEHRLYLRLFPPGQGVVAPLPFLAGSLSQAQPEGIPERLADGTSSPNNMVAFEVPPAPHAPSLRPAGWAELGEIPRDGTYTLRVSAADAGSRTFQLVLAPDRLELSPLPEEDPRAGDGQLEVGVARAHRLPRGCFTFRFESPHGFLDRDMVRKIWLASLLAAPGVELREPPAGPLSDTEFESWLEEGYPLLHARDAREIHRVVTELAVETGALAMIRWYGGLIWDLREVRDRTWPSPCCLPNLDYLIPAHLR